MLPFTTEEFFAVFATYNEAIWPAQVAAYLLGAVVVALILRPSKGSNEVVAGILALGWLWTGIAYHWFAFAPINPAALFFGSAFVAQACVFVWFGVVRPSISFGYRRDLAGRVGMALIVYSAAVYPLLGLLVGHTYPGMPMFGVTPCPVTILTFGALLNTRCEFSRAVLAIPVLWSLIGGSAAFLLGVPQDWALLFSGLTAVLLLVARDRHGKAGIRRADHDGGRAAHRLPRSFDATGFSGGNGGSNRRRSGPHREAVL